MNLGRTVRRDREDRPHCGAYAVCRLSTLVRSVQKVLAPERQHLRAMAAKTYPPPAGLSRRWRTSSGRRRCTTLPMCRFFDKLRLPMERNCRRRILGRGEDRLQVACPGIERLTLLGVVAVPVVDCRDAAFDVIEDFSDDETWHAPPRRVVP